MAEKHRVVILGAGFGGLYAAQVLEHDPVEVTIIDRRNFHLFQPLLYQVATGSLSPGEIAAPIRGIFSKQRNIRVLLGEAVDLDPKAKSVSLRDGATVQYDSLIVATGSQTSYFGHDDWRTWAPSLKSIEEATAIRHKILVAFEAAERIHDPEDRKSFLRFVIVGGGPTGVELAGAVGEIANETLKNDFRSIKPAEAQIMILDGGPRILSTYPEDLSKKAERSLLKLGVRVRSGVKVTRVDGDGVTFTGPNGEENLASRTVLWAAGVTVSDFAKKLAERTGAPTEKGHVVVEPDLTVPNYPDIYAIGDIALSKDEHGKPLPGVAQTAMQGGKYVAKTIGQRLRNPGITIKPFRYFNKGDLAVIGRGKAVANTFGLHLSGLLAWFVWLFIHLFYIVEFQSRILVFIQWGLQYLTHSRGARLITGDVAMPVDLDQRPLSKVVEA